MPLSSAYPVGSRETRHFRPHRAATPINCIARAMRHSRLRAVASHRRAGGSCGALLIVVVGANYMPTVGGLRLPGELGKMVIKGTKVTMQQPRLTGYTVDSRPYEFTANSAEQDITKPDLMELHQIQAKMEMEDKSTVNLTSASGSYDMKTEMLNLSRKHPSALFDRLRGALERCRGRRAQRRLVSEKPVWVKLTGTRDQCQAAGSAGQRRRHPVRRRRDDGRPAGPSQRAGERPMTQRLWFLCIDGRDGCVRRRVWRKIPQRKLCARRAQGILQDTEPGSAGSDRRRHA